jgi:NADPH-dependent glutamate synthase beta subunit-like oxidoreductase
MDCVSLLRDVSLGKTVKVGKRVAVVGGGNAAMDASRTALRLGAKEVTVFYRRTREEMPAAGEEVNEALEEGVNIEFLTAPNKIRRDNGHLKVSCIRMELGDIDDSGRRRPEPLAGSEFDEEFDVVIAAVGQKPEIPGQMEITTGGNGTISVDPDTLATGIDGVFAGGDVVSGPASVIEAIAAGRQAAVAIDKYLGGKGIIDEALVPPEEALAQPNIEEDEEHGRPDMPFLAVDQRLKGFGVVELGFPREKAAEEAGRCLRCDLEEE